MQKIESNPGYSTHTGQPYFGENKSEIKFLIKQLLLAIDSNKPEKIYKKIEKLEKVTEDSESIATLLTQGKEGIKKYEGGSKLTDTIAYFALGVFSVWIAEQYLPTDIFKIFNFAAIMMASIPLLSGVASIKPFITYEKVALITFSYFCVQHAEQTDLTKDYAPIVGLFLTVVSFFRILGEMPVFGSNPGKATYKIEDKSKIATMKLQLEGLNK